MLLPLTARFHISALVAHSTIRYCIRMHYSETATSECVRILPPPHQQPWPRAACTRTARTSISSCAWWLVLSITRARKSSAPRLTTLARSPPENRQWRHCTVYGTRRHVARVLLRFVRQLHCARFVQPHWGPISFHHLYGSWKENRTLNIRHPPMYAFLP